MDRDRYEDLYRTFNPRRARIVCDGGWGVAEGLVFDNFHVQDFNIEQKIKEIKENTHGMDYDLTNGPTTEISSLVDLNKKEIWIHGEHYEMAIGTDDIYKMLEGKGLLKASITGDSAEPSY